MGFFFRKSKSRGPFRLNFSKKGLGLSFGLKAPGSALDRAASRRQSAKADFIGEKSGIYSRCRAQLHLIQKVRLCQSLLLFHTHVHRSRSRISYGL